MAGDGKGFASRVLREHITRMTFSRTGGAVLAATGLVLAVVGLLEAQGGPARSVSIVSGASVLTTTAFSPNPTNVPVGTTVTWVNNDTTTHTSSDTGGAWNSPLIGPGGQFSFTFNTAGTYSYRCLIHSNMVGTISGNPASHRRLRPHR